MSRGTLTARMRSTRWRLLDSQMTGQARCGCRTDGLPLVSLGLGKTHAHIDRQGGSCLARTHVRRFVANTRLVPVADHRWVNWSTHRIGGRDGLRVCLLCIPTQPNCRLSAKVTGEVALVHRWAKYLWLSGGAQAAVPLLPRRLSRNCPAQCSQRRVCTRRAVAGYALGQNPEVRSHILLPVHRPSGDHGAILTNEYRSRAG